MRHSQRNMQRKAIIDLGTNTFHLFIVEFKNDGLHILYKEKIVVKIGENGISKNIIGPDAYERAINALVLFKNIIDVYGATDVNGVATSAIRNAQNGQSLLDKIEEVTGIEIQIISGDKEAELIYYGVKEALELSDVPYLIMDIGGGSVEFIIGNRNKIHWKQSFEIGAQRLLDKFHQVDPIEPTSIVNMENWLNEQLADLVIAVNTHQPTGLVGCSGTFDTLKDIYALRANLPVETQSPSSVLPLEAFHEIHQDLLVKKREERLEIPGMVKMRVDMIVVASCLINFVVSKLQIGEVVACSYALKEGILFHQHSKNTEST